MAAFATMLPGAWATDDCVSILPGGGGGSTPTGDAQAGVAIPAAFTGNPLTASVVLPAAYPNSNYSVATQVTSVSGRVIPTNVVNITATGFDIELCSQNINGMAGVRWQSQPYT